MNIAVAVKVVPDDQDIVVGADRSIDASKAHQIVSEYDLNALEAAAQLADATGAKLVAISASNGAADDLKVKKSILSRGPEELFMVADDGLAMADARTTAAALAKLVGDVEDGVDLVVCGDGSADMYAGQVDVQLASILGVPVVNKATGLSVEDGVLVVERTLDDCVEVVEVPARRGVGAALHRPAAHRRHARDFGGGQEARDGGRRRRQRRVRRGHRGRGGCEGPRARRPQAPDLRRFQGRRL